MSGYLKEKIEENSHLAGRIRSAGDGDEPRHGRMAAGRLQMIPIEQMHRSENYRILPSGIVRIKMIAGIVRIRMIAGEDDNDRRNDIL